MPSRGWRRLVRSAWTEGRLDKLIEAVKARKTLDEAEKLAREIIR